MPDNVISLPAEPERRQQNLQYVKLLWEPRRAALFHEHSFIKSCCVLDRLGFCFHFYVEHCHTACKSVPGERQIRTSLMLIGTPKVNLNHKVFRPVIIGLMFTQELDTNTAVSHTAQLNIIY